MEKLKSANGFILFFGSKNEFFFSSFAQLGDTLVIIVKAVSCLIVSSFFWSKYNSVYFQSMPYNFMVTKMALVCHKCKNVSQTCTTKAPEGDGESCAQCSVYL